MLRTVNPDLIMCSVSGFGVDGPYSHRPAFDPIIQSVAGYPEVQADANGVPDLMATAVCDKTTSLHVAQSICAALVGRANGAGGQHIELAMVDVAVHFLFPEAMWHHIYLDHTSDMPNLSDIYSLFQTSDGWAMVYPVATQAHWQSMCRAFGRDDLATDPRFADLQGRVRYGAEVNEEIQAEMLAYTTAELIALMDEADVPAAPVNTRANLARGPPHPPPRDHRRNGPSHRRSHPPGPAPGALLGDAVDHAPPRPHPR